METFFFSPQDISIYFKTGLIKKELHNPETIGICSIGDLLYVTEQYKKGILKIGQEDLQKKYQGINSAGFVHIAELDSDRLSSSLFERNANHVVTGLDENASISTISPTKTVRLLTLKICDQSVWWSDQVQQEMEQYHNEEE